MRVGAKSLDHVALWVADRDRLAEFLCDHLAMHVIERSDEFTLVGVDARRGKLTLFAAEGPREPGVLDRIVLRVSDLERAIAGLPSEIEIARGDSRVAFSAPEGLGLGLVARSEGIDFDLDEIVLRVPEPGESAERLATMGFERRDGSLFVADKSLRLERGPVRPSERPLLNHLALLVDSAEELRREATAEGYEVEKVVDAENTLAVFVRGPDGILIEFVEHKPGFSLR